MGSPQIPSIHLHNWYLWHIDSLALRLADLSDQNTVRVTLTTSLSAAATMVESRDKTS